MEINVLKKQKIIHCHLSLEGLIEITFTIFTEAKNAFFKLQTQKNDVMLFPFTI